MGGTKKPPILNLSTTKNNKEYTYNEPQSNLTKENTKNDQVCHKQNTMS